MGTPTPVAARPTRTRHAGGRGIDAERPDGWSVPDPAEKLASFAKAMGWSVQSEWFASETGLVRLKVELGRMLLPGERKKEAPGDRWIYKLIWEEIPENERSSYRWSKMRLVVSRALTPGKGVWHDGPTLKMISDLIGRHPMPVSAIANRSVVQPVRIKPNPTRIG